jgi:hypothetical protein
LRLPVANAYFKGGRKAFFAVLRAFNRDEASRRDHVAWQQARDKKPADRQTANRLLTNAVNAANQAGSNVPPLGRQAPDTPAER